MMHQVESNAAGKGHGSRVIEALSAEFQVTAFSTSGIEPNKVAQ